MIIGVFLLKKENGKFGWPTFLSFMVDNKQDYAFILCFLSNN